MKKKKENLKKYQYTTDALYRWNLCQRIGKILYNSEKDIEELERLYDNIQEE